MPKWLASLALSLLPVAIGGLAGGMTWLVKDASADRQRDDEIAELTRKADQLEKQLESESMDRKQQDMALWRWAGEHANAQDLHRLRGGQ